MEIVFFRCVTATALEVRLATARSSNAGSATTRVAVTLHNPRRAQHPGGFWELGDPGSVHLRDLRVSVGLPPVAAQTGTSANTGDLLVNPSLPPLSESTMAAVKEIYDRRIRPHVQESW